MKRCDSQHNHKSPAGAIVQNVEVFIVILGVVVLGLVMLSVVVYPRLIFEGKTEGLVAEIYSSLFGQY
jgi:hypothetical protein